MNKPPCKNCKYRQLGCHDYCLPFLEFKEVNEVIRERKREGSDFTGHIVDNMEKMLKKKRQL